MEPPAAALNCLIVDDEPLARECLTNYVREIDFLQTVGTANNPIELTQLLDEQTVDLVFLDIQMPKMSGVDFLRQHRNLPSIILTTAFPGYALEGYALDVVDYLLKPITFTRFFQAVSKVRRQVVPRTAVSPGAVELGYFYIKCEQRYERIQIEEVLYVKALQNYVEIHTLRGRFVTLLSLSSVEEYVGAHPFLRVHKSYLVAAQSIDTIDGNEIVIGEHRIPISRSQRSEVLQRVVEGKLWKK